MSPTSFKKNLGQRPQHYRTPSPPRLAFEPISPIHTESEAHQVHWRDGARFYDGINLDSSTKSLPITGWRVPKEAHSNKMEAFASIALAITPASLVQTERPSKRARSEKLRSSDWTRTEAKIETRPVTSYEQSSDNRTLEAELLLNFSHEARFSNSWKDTRQANFEDPDEPHRTTLNQVPSHHSDPDHKNEPAVDTARPALPETLSDTGLEMNGGPYETSTRVPIIVPQDSAAEHVEPIHKERSARAQGSETEHEASELNQPSSIDTVSPLHTDYCPVTALPSPLNKDIREDMNLATSTNDQGPILTGNINVEKPHESIVKDSGDSRILFGMAEAVFDTAASSEAETILLPHEAEPDSPSAGNPSNTEATVRQSTLPAVCSACHFARNSTNVDTDSNSTSWISCDGCKSWFHFACAGFKNEREVRGVDKYRCRKCKSVYGATTYVRKSSRAHSAIDYAGLNEGVLKTSDERPEHHYIKPIKDGIITFLPDNFARMRPELVTADYFEKGNGMKEPLVIPAHFNPQPMTSIAGDSTEGHEDPESLDDWLPQDVEYQSVPDHGQDGLDMVMPQKLTVRQVAELYGPEEKVEVIDVKSQNGEGKKWNMRRWADYYESSSNKAVRNVISLEVSQSKLGRLIRRPQVVRDLDLQDSVWPQELQARGEFPRVQLYCLMSVADCFTDFHIDFGGSSVFYHILKGKKTFLFIPPKEKHLKKYEEWCMSPAQNWTFLADQTKECYRVDLSEGDTMLIPAGWIHAVWTPEDSLVIGGNFLTRMHYGMQLRIAQIEKSTGVARKFRYPHFQKLHWYTVLQYLEDDPLPDSIREILQEGGVFHREQPAHYGHNDWGENSISGSENYHARYYSQAELEGVPDLTRYLLRTALIDLGSITEGITPETRNAVKKAIPRGYGEPLDIVKDFAMWCAWKRGNEPIPHWAYPHAVPEGGASDSAGKLSAAALKKLDQEAALQAPRRQSARRQSQLLLSAKASALSMMPDCDGIKQDSEVVPDLSNIGMPTDNMHTPLKRRFNDMINQETCDLSPSDSSKRQRRNSKTRRASHRKPACESCRKRRRACKHRDLVKDQVDDTRNSGSGITPSKPIPNSEAYTDANDLDNPTTSSLNGEEFGVVPGQQETLEVPNGGIPHSPEEEAYAGGAGDSSNPHKKRRFSQSSLQLSDSNAMKSSDLGLESKHRGAQSKESDAASRNPTNGRGRTKACNDCRKSKRRCIHDQLGNEDPIKARATAVPRPAATLKRRKLDAESPSVHPVKGLDGSPRSEHFDTDRPALPRTPTPAYPPHVAENSSDAITEAEDDQLHLSTSTSEPGLRLTSCRESAEVQSQVRADALDEKSGCVVAKTKKVADHNLHNSDATQLIEGMTVVDEENGNPTPLKQTRLVVHRSTNSQIDSLEQPAASSLVSPPASSHDDNGKSPPPSQTELTPSTSSSRHSSRYPKQVQRYTPESGPARRTSSSSAGEANAGKSASAARVQLTIETLPVVAVSRRENRIDGVQEIVPDEESLKLIKELQAEEHGLRRRRRS